MALMAEASHPTAEGYARWATHLQPAREAARLRVP